MAKSVKPDVVGYEYDEALEICRQQGIEPVYKATGDDTPDGVVRVVRQQWTDGSLVLTCACEAWS